MTHTTITLESVKSAMSDSVESVRSMYVQADTSGKAKIRGFVTKVQNERLANDDLVGAKEAMMLLSSLKSSSSSKSEVSGRDLFATYVASVVSFYTEVTSGRHVPEGIEVSETDIEDILANADDLDEMHNQADSDILDKFLKVRGTVQIRRDVSKHLEQVFSDLPVGTVLTFANVASRTSEEYGTDHPSSGAVAAVTADRAKSLGLERIAADRDKGIKGSLRKIA